MQISELEIGWSYQRLPLISNCLDYDRSGSIEIPELETLTSSLDKLYYQQALVFIFKNWSDATIQSLKCDKFRMFYLFFLLGKLELIREIQDYKNAKRAKVFPLENRHLTIKIEQHEPQLKVHRNLWFPLSPSLSKCFGEYYAPPPLLFKSYFWYELFSPNSREFTSGLRIWKMVWILCFTQN